MVSWQRYTQLMWMICGRWVVAAKGLIEDQGEGWTTGWCACKNRRGGNFHKAKWHLLTQAPEYPCGPGQSNKGSLSLFLVRHDGQFTFSLLSPRPRHWYLPQLPPFSTPSLCMLFVPKCLNQLHLLTSHPQLLHPTSLLLLYILDCMRLLFFLTFFTTMFLWRLHSFFMFFLGYCTPTFSSSCQMSPQHQAPMYLLAVPHWHGQCCDPQMSRRKCGGPGWLLQDEAAKRRTVKYIHIYSLYTAAMYLYSHFL